MPKLCKSIKRKFPSNSTLLKTFCQLKLCNLHAFRGNILFSRNHLEHTCAQHYANDDDTLLQGFKKPTDVKSKSNVVKLRSHQLIHQTLISLGFLISLQCCASVKGSIGISWSNLNSKGGGAFIGLQQ